MDQDLHHRIEALEVLCRQTLEAVSSFRVEFKEMREEQREHAARTEALLKQLGARVGSVEGRVSAVEERPQAVEEVVFN